MWRRTKREPIESEQRRKISVAAEKTHPLRRPVSAGCDTLPIINVLEAQRKGDRL
jgi:hypothetical protein